MPSRCRPGQAEGWRASADGQAYYLGGPGEAGGLAGARYGRDPIVKIHTTITDRYAPLHQTVARNARPRRDAGTAHEAIHALDGILGHTSGVSPSALHVDGGGVSDVVFALMHLLGLDFEPRIPRLSDRRLYAFEPARRYGRLAPLFGRRLDRDLIIGHWDEIGRVVEALRSRTVMPSLIRRCAVGLPAAELPRRRAPRDRPCRAHAVHPTLVQGPRASPARHRRAGQGRSPRQPRARRGPPPARPPQATAASRTSRPAPPRGGVVTAAIILFNCRHLGRAVVELRRRGGRIDDALVAQLSPLGWDRINLTGDYVWSDAITLDGEGLMPLALGGRS